MAKHRHSQVNLSKTQPPFPGGWVSVLLQIFAELDSSEDKKRGAAPRTWHRIQKDGSHVKRATYLKLKRDLVARFTITFPRTSECCDFISDYVNEYFRLWEISAEGVHYWVPIRGRKTVDREALIGALLRDLVLRLAYLASIERHLSGDTTIPLMQADSIERIYALCIHGTRKGTRTLEEAAADLEVDEKTLRRWKSGKHSPRGRAIRRLAESGNSSIVCVGFIDRLLRRFNLRQTPFASESIRAFLLFFRQHQQGLTALDQRKNALGGHLLHPGAEAIVCFMPDSLWRAHTYSLRFARSFDLARAYLRFAKNDNCHQLIAFLDRAEHESGGDPGAWMQLLDAEPA